MARWCFYSSFAFNYTTKIALSQDYKNILCVTKCGGMFAVALPRPFGRSLTSSIL